jgi:phenylalanyl-tRNA synthetase alpha chain
MASEVENLARLQAEALRAIAAAETPQALTETRARFLGRKGSVAALLRGIGALEAARRGPVGQAVNTAKQRIEEAVQARRGQLEQRGVKEALGRGHLDVTLPGARPPRGHLHPLTRIDREIAHFFHALGFAIEDGPEVETDWHNFEALNFPDDHPARDMQDTFFVEGGFVLRTHTSPVQIRAMTGRTPPFRFITPGRVYRHDSSSTHSPMFRQVEGFLVDERVTFGDLKGVLYEFARFLLGEHVQLRFRASFFPFTEPSAELDFSWEDGWLEWGGCGMIHPRVLENCGIDAERYQGFAFGMGVERAAMLRFDLPHIQLLYDADLRVLEQL